MSRDQPQTTGCFSGQTLTELELFQMRAAAECARDEAVRAPLLREIARLRSVLERISGVSATTPAAMIREWAQEALGNAR